MKLTIQRLISLSAQDLIDLAKIWPEQTQNDWQASLQNDRALFAAVFNERILGAVKIRLNGSQGELSDLLVREVTRRRGVGLYLMEDLQAQLPQVKSWTMKAEPEPVLDAFMTACGFHHENGFWIKKPAGAQQTLKPGTGTFPGKGMEGGSEHACKCLR